MSEERKAQTKTPKKKERVAIVGCASSKDMAPYGDDSWEFWGVNNLFLTMPKVKWSRWFEIHEFTRDPAGNWIRRGKNDFRGQPVNDYVKGLLTLKCPIYMQRHWPEIPNSVPYPLAEVKRRFGNYLTNTVSIEICLALMEGFKEIGIWGVDMAVGSEWQNQRPSCEYFIGLAEGMGVKVIIPDEADLLKTRFIYGFEEPKEAAWRKKCADTLKHIDRQINDARVQQQNARDKEMQGIGARTAVVEMDKIWSNPA